MNRLLVSLVFLAAPCLAFAQVAQRVDASKSQVRFVSKQMGVAVEGVFRKFEGTVAFDPAKPQATKANIEVVLGSIDLDDAESETEVKRPLWFDTARFPNARFTLAALKPVGTNKYEASGALSIKGVSKDIVAPVTLAESGGQRTLEGQFTLKRLQFRIGEGQWSETDTVADDVLVRFRFVIPAH